MLYLVLRNNRWTYSLKQLGVGMASSLPLGIYVGWSHFQEGTTTVHTTVVRARMFKINLIREEGGRTAVVSYACERVSVF